MNRPLFLRLPKPEPYTYGKLKITILNYITKPIVLVEGRSRNYSKIKRKARRHRKWVRQQHRQQRKTGLKH